MSGVEVLLLVLGSAAALLVVVAACKLMGSERLKVDKGPLGLHNLHGTTDHPEDAPEEDLKLKESS
jgi:hypothetical protein